MLRRTEYLITEIRNSTDNKDTNGVPDSEIIAYLNYGQRIIQNIVFKFNPKADLFKATKAYTPSIDATYSLPSDIFAENAIELLEVQVGTPTINSGWVSISRVSKGEASSLYGYYVENGIITITGVNLSANVRVTYFKELPRMEKRWGQIQSFVSGTSITLNSSTYDTSINTIDDRITVVNKFGSQKLSNIFIDTFSANVLSTTNTLNGIAVGDYVCMGGNSVNASELPAACETYLLDYTRQRIYTRNVYNDANKQVYFTDKQEADIGDLFKNNQKGVLFPPITDTSMLEW